MTPFSATLAAALLLAGQTVTRDTIRDFEPDTLMAAAPFGVDVTLDETVWINMAETGRPSDYAVRARDFFDRKMPYVTVWIRGYHRRNPKLNYRESKLRVTFDCKGERYSQEYSIYYRADGTILDEQTLRENYVPVVPGTQAANWLRFICRPPSDG